MAANTVRIRARIGGVRAVVRATPWEPNKDFWSQPAWNTKKWGDLAAVDSLADENRKRKLALLDEHLRAGDQEAIDLARVTILVMSQFQELKLAGHRRGGKTKAKNAVDADLNAWMRPIFDQAYALLVADGSRQHGHAKLLLLAHRVACDGHPDHGRRDKLKESHARNYLADRRRKKNRDGC
jgi:hypothetical protein